MAGEEQVAAVLWTEALCRARLGRLGQAAFERLVAGAVLGVRELDPMQVRQLEAAVAVAATLGATGVATLAREDLGGRLRLLLQLDTAWHELRVGVSEGDAPRRALGEHALDWVCVSGVQLTFASEGAAREARMLLAEGTLSAGEVASRAGVAAERRRLYLDTAAPEIAGRLVATAAGEPADPWVEDGSWQVLLVEAKIPPSLDDPRLRDLAVEEVMNDVLRRHAAGRAAERCVL